MKYANDSSGVSKSGAHLDNGFAVTSVPRQNEWQNGKVAESAETECLNSGGFT